MDKKFETKSFDFEIKASDDEEMMFEGYGSIFGNLDSYRDIVEKGAFGTTLQKNGRNKKGNLTRLVYGGRKNEDIFSRRNSLRLAG